MLLEAYRQVTRDIDQGRAITPPGEWLVDNYHIVERQIRAIHSDLPPGYYRQLPKLADGPFEGYPRVFGVAWAFVAHTDSRFDSEMLIRYVRAYQEVQPLTIGELWAVAITLRIVLVENLRRLADLIVHSAESRQEADDLADRLLGGDGRAAEPVAAVLDGLERGRRDGRFRGRARAPAARSGSADHAGADLARPEPGRARRERRFGRARRASAPGHRDGDGAQHHHQHAADLRRRLDRAVRAHQPGRRRAGRRQRVSGHGFSHPQSLPQRHRGAGARRGPLRDRYRPPRRAGGRDGHGGRRERSPPRRSGLSSARRRTPCVRSRDRLSGRGRAPGSAVGAARWASGAMRAPSSWWPPPCSPRRSSGLQPRCRTRHGWPCSPRSAPFRPSTPPWRWSTAASCAASAPRCCPAWSCGTACHRICVRLLRYRCC